MATMAQLQAESWWGREVVTPELDWLGDELCRRTARPRVAAGSKGDTAHMRGAHRSQEWIVRSQYCTSRTYTAQQGLTAEQQTHVAGFDFTPGSAAQMIAMCRRLDAALRAGDLEEIREFYGNTNGDRVVDGWDNLHNRAATSDDSHLWHIHISFDRRQLRNRALMERVVAIALGDPQQDQEDDMTPDQAKQLDQLHRLFFTDDFTKWATQQAGGKKTTGLSLVLDTWHMLRNGVDSVYLGRKLLAIEEAAKAVLTPEQLAAVEAAAERGAEAGADDALDQVTFTVTADSTG